MNFFQGNLPLPLEGRMGFGNESGKADGNLTAVFCRLQASWPKLTMPSRSACSS